MPQVMELFQSGGIEFYDLRHQTIYQTMLELWEDRVPIDTVNLYERLSLWQKAEQVGGLAYISTLPEGAPTSFAWQSYAETIRSKYLLRKIIRASTEISGRCFDFDGTEPEALLNECENLIFSVREEAKRKDGYLNITATITDLEGQYLQARDNKNPPGLSTGFPDLDRISGGMEGGEMIVIAGLRSSGKTSLAMNIAWFVANEVGLPVGIVSMETMGISLIHRQLASIGEYNAMEIKRGNASEEMWERLVVAASTLSAARDRMFIYDGGPLPPLGLIAKCRRMVQQGAKLLVIDYLQLIEVGLKSEYESVTAASKCVKKIAMTLNVPVIVICSLNREGDKEDSAPQIKHIRATGQIEYDANKIWIVHSKEKEIIRQSELNIAKGKDSGTGKIDLTFFASQFRFASAARPGQAEAEEWRSTLPKAQSQPELSVVDELPTEPEPEQEAAIASGDSPDKQFSTTFTNGEPIPEPME